MDLKISIALIIMTHSSIWCMNQDPNKILLDEDEEVIVEPLKMERYPSATMRDLVKKLFDEHDKNNNLTMNLAEAKVISQEDMENSLVTMHRCKEWLTQASAGCCPFIEATSDLQLLATNKVPEAVIQECAHACVAYGLHRHSTKCKCRGECMLHVLARTNARVLEKVILTLKNEKGFNINIKTNIMEEWRMTPVEKATDTQHVDELIVLLRHGGDPASSQYYTRRDALMKLLKNRIEKVKGELAK